MAAKFCRSFIRVILDVATAERHLFCVSRFPKFVDTLVLTHATRVEHPCDVGKSRSWSRRRLTVCIALCDVLGKIFRIVRLSKFGSSQRIYCWTLNSLNFSETYGYHRRFGFASEYVGKGRQFLFNFTNFSSESCWFVHRYVDQIVDHIFLHIDFICRISLTFCDHQLNAFVPPIPYI